MVLGAINGATDLTVGGSADLTHSNLTLTKGMGRIAPGDYAGRYIHYGIREHGMAAAMNGIALHGGFVPYGGTFLCFADYARGAIRLSALMGQRVIYVMTHDSIGLGEDGPTHQPIEHLAMLRATPNLNVFRPADVVETAECWELALRSADRPSVLVLSRQSLPMLRTIHAPDNRSAEGAYVLREAAGQRDVTLIATGSEVEIARAAADLLHARHGHRAPRWSRCPAGSSSRQQDEAYRAGVLGSAPRVAVEAAARLGWDRWIGERGAFIGMNGFGASAPAADLYRHFGITPDAVADAALKLVACEDGMTLELARPFDMLAEKTVLLRANLDGGVTPELGLTVATLAGRGARVAIISGFGSPHGEFNPTLSLLRFREPIAMSSRTPVSFVPDCVGPRAEAGLDRVAVRRGGAAGEFALLRGRASRQPHLRDPPQRARRLFRHQRGRARPSDRMAERARQDPAGARRRPNRHIEKRVLTMARITLRQLLDHAAEHGYGVPAFNINNMEQGLAIMEAARACDAPVIIQASRGARSYANDVMLARMIDALAEMYPEIPLCVHQDHGNSEATCLTRDPPRLHLGDDGRLAEADARTPATYDYNVAITERVARMAHWVGASVEGELGVLGSLESGQARPRTGTAPRARCRTTSC